MAHDFLENNWRVFFSSLCLTFSGTITWPGLLDPPFHDPPVSMGWLSWNSSHDFKCCIRRMLWKKTCQDTWSLQRTKLHIVQWRLEESVYNNQLCHGSHSCTTKLSQNISYWNILMFSVLHKKVFVMKLYVLLIFFDWTTVRIVWSHLYREFTN